MFVSFHRLLIRPNVDHDTQALASFTTNSSFSEADREIMVLLDNQDRFIYFRIPPLGTVSPLLLCDA